MTKMDNKERAGIGYSQELKLLMNTLIGMLLFTHITDTL